MSKTEPRNIAELIEQCGGVSAFGKAIYGHSGTPRARAGDIKRRGFIPAPKWPAVRRLAKRLRIPLPIEKLERWHNAAAKKRREYRGAYK